MKIVVVSDSHRRFSRLEEIRKRNSDAEVFIHCGDLEVSKEYAQGYILVLGNNDYYSSAPLERILEYEGVKILVTHSHLYYYNRRIDDLWQKAKRLSCSLVCFGHTHQPYYEQREGIWLVNPGSLVYNRDGSPCGYLVITLEKSIVKSIERIHL